MWCDLDRQLWLSSTDLLVSRFPERVTTLLGVRVTSIYWQYTDESQKNPQGGGRSIEGQIYAQELDPGRFQNQYFMFFLKMVSSMYTYELTLDSFRLVLTIGLLCTPSIYIGSGDSNSDPHACTTSSLTTVPCPHRTAAF